MTRISGDWINNPATQTICAAISSEGARALFVGGCVRNTLLGEPVRDIDITTDAVPETVVRLAKANGIKAVPTGIDHGTVTLVAGGIAHEVTTFRRDVETDGRHAKVVFSTKLTEDAARRDFTMNALYARADGTLIDPLDGLADLRARRVRFIGDANKRIVEDHLRSLRYFRFCAWYGDPSLGFDPDALWAINRNLAGLERLSRERIGAEMLRLLSASDPAPAVAAMRSTGVLGQVLPGADDRALAPLVHLESEAAVPPDPVRRLAAVGGQDLVTALRLSKSQFRQLSTIRHAVSDAIGPAELGYRLKRRAATDALLVRNALLGEPWKALDLAEIVRGADAEFPVHGKDILNGRSGREIGEALARMEALWIASDFKMTREELLKQA